MFWRRKAPPAAETLEEKNYESPRRFPKVMSGYSLQRNTGQASPTTFALRGRRAGLAPVLHFWRNAGADVVQTGRAAGSTSCSFVPSGALWRWRRFRAAHFFSTWGAVRAGGSVAIRELGFQATGVDATPGMLGRAIECGTTAPLIAGEACYLPFANATFDCVSDITVVQHIPRSMQPQALREMMRVLKPGGRLILMELIRGEDAHIFPRSPQDWIQQVALCGGKPIGWFGQEYLLLDRIFVYMAQKLTARNGAQPNPDVEPLQPGPQHSSLARRIFWAIRRLTAPLSAWTDPIAGKVCPAHIATHAVFVFRK